MIDEELVRRASRKQMEAFDELVERYMNKVYTIPFLYGHQGRSAEHDPGNDGQTAPFPETVQRSRPISGYTALRSVYA